MSRVSYRVAEGVDGIDALAGASGDGRGGWSCS